MMSGKVTRRSVLLGGVLAPALAGCGLFDDGEKPAPLKGERLDVLSTGDGLEADAQDLSGGVTLPPSVVEADWKQAGRIPSHQAINAELGSTREIWSDSIGSGVSDLSPLSYLALAPNGRGVIDSQPVVADGRVFTIDACGEVSAFDNAGQRRLWRLDPRKEDSLSRNMGGGLGVDGEYLYIVDGIATALCVHAASGKIKWRVDIGTPGRSAPTIHEGRVYFVTIDNVLHVLEAETGSNIWSYQATVADTALFGIPAPTIGAGVVLAGFSSGDVAALRSETGEVVWSDTLGSTNGRNSVLDFPSIRGLPAIVDDTAYLISVAGVMLAVDMRSGRRLWGKEVAGQNALVVTDSLVFVLSTEQQLACLDRRTGHVKWMTQLRRFENEEDQSNALTWTGPVLAGGRLICCSNSSKYGMCLVDAANGRVISTQETAAPVTVAPVVAGGRLYVVSADGRLTVYG